MSNAKIKKIRLKVLEIQRFQFLAGGSSYDPVTVTLKRAELASTEANHCFGIMK